MALPGTPHTVKIGVLFTFGTDAQQCVNLVYLNDPTDAIKSNPSATAAAVQTAANAQLVPQLFPLVKLTGVEYEDVSTFPFGGITVPQAAVAGTKAGGVASLPSNCCIAVRKNTGNLGRSGRGRWYWPLADAAALTGTNDTVNATYQAAIVSALGAFQAAVKTALPSADMGIVSYRNGGVQRSAGLFQTITSWSITDSLVDTQRRRLTGRGR